MIGRTRALAVAGVLLAGCGAREQRPSDRWDLDGDGVARVAVLGDSNSFTYLPHNWTLALRKHLRRTERGRWRIAAFARPGARITDHLPDRRLSGAYQIEQVLAVRPPPEVVILAFGTNDVRGGRTVGDVLDAYRTATTRLGAVARVRIATTPPCWDEHCDPAAIAALNQALRETGPPAELLDFDSWVTREHVLPDLVHFNAPGHWKRLMAALDMLLEHAPVTPPPPPP
jgi:lysophospholipase L1-like esterase